MHVLIIFAHPKSKGSFNHAILDEFTRGLQDAGHSYEVVDLYRINFDPVIRTKDFVFFADTSIPEDVLEAMEWKKTVLSESSIAPLGFLKKMLAEKWLSGKSLQEIVYAIGKKKPKDVLVQQKKLASADAIALISPIYWLNFPAIMKGWMERVFTYGFAYKLAPEGWKGNSAGRVPLLSLKKALVMNTTFFSEEDYRSKGFHDAMTRIIDDWGLRYPGIKEVEHVYFYAVAAVSDNKRKEYLQAAYSQGKNF